MSIPDTPDYTDAVVAAQILLASNPPATTTATVQLPGAVTALWIYNAQLNSEPAPVVTGTATGTLYPCYATLIASTGSGAPGPFIALVNPILDSEVTVTAPGTNVLDWYVIGDTSMRVTASLPLTVYPIV